MTSRSFTGKPKSAKLMAMPPPMVPAPTTAAVLISGSCHVLRLARDLGDLALGEEGVAQGLGLVGVLELRKQPPLGLDALVERLAHRRLDAGDAVVGRLLVAGFARDRLAHGIEHAGIGLGLGQPVGLVAHARQWPLAGDALGVGDRLGAQVLARRRSRRRCRAALASAAGTWRPETIISIAAFGPMRRGRRCVPPPPGRMPISTSGRPTLALGTAMR